MGLKTFAFWYKVLAIASQISACVQIQVGFYSNMQNASEYAQDENKHFAVPSSGPTTVAHQTGGSDVEVPRSSASKKMCRPPGVATMRLTLPSPLSNGETPASCPPNERRLPLTVTHSGHSNTHVGIGVLFVVCVFVLLFQ